MLSRHANGHATRTRRIGRVDQTARERGVSMALTRRSFLGGAVSVADLTAFPGVAAADYYPSNGYVYSLWVCEVGTDQGFTFPFYLKQNAASNDPFNWQDGKGDVIFGTYNTNIHGDGAYVVDPADGTHYFLYGEVLEPDGSQGPEYGTGNLAIAGP